MSTPFVGEIRVVGFNFAPKGWATCDGQILAISQNTALFSLLGVNFGGNGTSNFGLPNFQGLAPVSQGAGNGLTPYGVGENAGAPTVTLLATNLPAHNHNPFLGDEEPAQDLNPAGDLYAGAAKVTYAAPTAGAYFTPSTVQYVGNSQPHDNMAPYQALLYIIALQGIYPARN